MYLHPNTSVFMSLKICVKNKKEKCIIFLDTSPRTLQFLLLLFKPITLVDRMESPNHQRLCLD